MNSPWSPAAVALKHNGEMEEGQAPPESARTKLFSIRQAFSPRFLPMSLECCCYALIREEARRTAHVEQRDEPIHRRDPVPGASRGDLGVATTATGRDGVSD